MPGLLGKKLGMTSVYTENGENVPVTVIEAGPCQVVEIRTNDKDGYEALQLGFGIRKDKHTNKPLAGICKKNNVKPAKVLKEFKNFNIADYKLGDEITVEAFKVGDRVKITSKSIGKGFQGVMRRHGFGGVGQATHGQHNRLRHPGSIGQSSYPSRVLKGMKMAGRQGNEKVTLKNVSIVKVIPEKNVILVKGAVPGAVNSIVEIKN